MLPASNKGVGMNMGFPDVCLTPAVPSPVPIPYPNMAMNAMAAPFCPTILLSCMPALNQGSIIPMTMGMEPGVANPLYMQMGMYTMGNPKVLLQCLPAINLTCPTTGNGMNNAAGAVLVPSVTNVFFTYAGVEGSRDSATGTLTLADLVDLQSSLSEPTAAPAVEATLTAPGVGSIRIRRFSADVPSAVFHALRGLLERGMRAAVLDLRGNPGGETSAAIELAGDFLEAGSIIATLTDVDGDEVAYRAQQPCSYRFPVALLVDGNTASAAELFAGSLHAHGRAIVLGQSTYGKNAAQMVVRTNDGPVYATVGKFSPPFASVQSHAGVEPDAPMTAKGVATVADRLPRELLSVLAAVAATPADRTSP